MNFEHKSTFKSKWKRFWIICLKIWVKINVKISLNSCLIGLYQLYTGGAGGSSRGKVSWNIFQFLSPQCVPCGLVVMIRPRAQKILSSNWAEPVFLFSSFFLFLFECKVLMSQMSHESWVNESMSQIWKNKSFGRNNKIKHYFYWFCLLPSLLPAQGLFLTWNLALGCLLAVPRPCRIAEAKNKPA